MIRRWFALFVSVAIGWSETPEEILQRLSEITGLKVIRKVDQQTMKRDQLKAYFEERIKEVVKPEEIRVEELALKKLGFAPPDFDLKTTTVDLMTEQAAAFYDYRKKKMVLLDSSQGMLQDLALIHELAHALADQHFNLEKFLRKAGANDDGALARMAVMEGQATWLMSEFTAKNMGQSLLGSDSMVEMMSKMAGGGGSGFPVFESVPLYLRESLVFPYAKGMLFQHKVLAKSGKQGFAEVFRRPPQTTREILHPEIYFAKATAEAPRLPDLARPKEWKQLSEGTVGEFDHKILLRQYAKEYESLAEAWRGGTYQLWEAKKDKRVALAYATSWEDEAAARKFFDVYQQVLAAKWKRCEFGERSAIRAVGHSEDGWFSVSLEGRGVASIEGLNALSDGR